MKLISMTDFVLEQDDKVRKQQINSFKFTMSVTYYAIFLKQPLTLGMFVPCDEDGNVLEEPDFFDGSYDDNGYGDVDKIMFKECLKEYQQAKERVLFDGCEIKAIKDHYYVTKEGNENIFWASWNTLKTIEHLIQYNLTLTKTAIKQLGL